MSMLDRALGVPPCLDSSLTDLAGMLTRRHLRAIARVLEKFESQFPQVTPAFVACHSPPGIPLRGYLFWLFNRSQIVPAVENGGGNRLILIGLDPTNGTVACILGYGLEPFIAPSVLSEALALSEGCFSSGDIAQGVNHILEHLGGSLTRVSEDAPLAFGLRGEPLHGIDQLSDQPAAAALAY